MKVLDLRCQHDHAFEGWFAGEQDFQDQLQRNLVQCPLCGDSLVRKVLSAPRLNLGACEPRPVSASDKLDSAPVSAGEPSKAPAPSLPAAMLQALRKVVAQAEDVGPRFADEARRMHQGDVPERAIRGQASAEEAAQLLDEGIAVLPLPTLVTQTLH
jgi:hypothetical protein